MSVAKLRELKRLFQIIKTPSVIFCYAKNDSPLKDEAKTRIEFDIDCGLRFNVFFKFDNSRELSYIRKFARQEQAPALHGWIYNSIRAKHPLLFTFHFSPSTLLCRKAHPCPYGRIYISNLTLPTAIYKKRSALAER